MVKYFELIYSYRIQDIYLVKCANSLKQIQQNII